MEVCFNRCKGKLDEKLMSALQGAKVPGADKRCLEKNVSSLSAFIIVANPADKTAEYYLNLNVENVYPSDPIDILQLNYNTWKAKNK